jgi:hypothetical protein
MSGARFAVSDGQRVSCSFLEVFERLRGRSTNSGLSQVVEQAHSLVAVAAGSRPP